MRRRRPTALIVLLRPLAEQLCVRWTMSGTIKWAWDGVTGFVWRHKGKLLTAGALAAGATYALRSMGDLSKHADALVNSIQDASYKQMAMQNRCVRERRVWRGSGTCGRDVGAHTRD